MEGIQTIPKAINDHIHRHIINYFLILCLVYLAFFFLFLFSSRRIFEFHSHGLFIAGLIIGAIYVLIPLYYFSAHFLLPYTREVSATLKDSNNYPRIALWVVQWIIPTMILQLFTVFGFWITVERSPFFDNIFVYPYKFGKVFKEVESLKLPPIASSQAEPDLKNRIALEQEHLRLLSPSLQPPLPEIGPSKTPSQAPREASYKEMEMNIYKIPFLIAVAFGFLGTMIYTLRDMAYRFYTQDLLPKTFVNYLIRFILVPCLCIVIAFFFMNDWPVNIAPILFFSVGFFPQRAVQFIEEKTATLFSLKKREIHEISLGLIQGMTDYTLSRFHEIGVSDVQNLAFIDLSYLGNNLGFDRKIIYDFVSQALLLVYAGEDFGKFQKANIRDIISLKCLMDTIKQRTGGEPPKIPDIVRENLFSLSCIFENELVAERIKMLNFYLAKTKEREQNQIERMITVR